MSEPSIDVDPFELGAWLARTVGIAGDSPDLRKTSYFSAGVAAQKQFPNDGDAHARFWAGYIETADPQ